MGWIFTPGRTKAELVRELVAVWIEENKRGETLAHKVVGNVLWAVKKNTCNQGDVIVWIGCYLLENGGKDQGWGYKPLTEDEGPCYYTCPLEYLDRVPEPKGPYVKEWRKKVRAYHAKQQQLKTLTVGQRVELDYCKIPYVEFQALRGKHLIGTGPDGVLYRVGIDCIKGE